MMYLHESVGMIVSVTVSQAACTECPNYTKNVQVRNVTVGMCMYLHVSVGIMSVSALIMMMYLLISESLRLACQYIHPSVP